MENPLPWWQTAVFYQIYPRSFADSNRDGIGDIGGIIQKLDYLQDLGINAIWLSPHFPSPQVDWGYDISDYCGVAPEYGTLSEFQALLDGIHRRGMHLILDLVLNHTSDQHPWFGESRSSRDNPQRDWYVWKPGRGDQPPNNWYSVFGGPAWEYDPNSGEWYYHFFFKEQPDLNWRNPEVKQAMFDVVRFWLDMGVDGFRLDAIGTVFEHTELPDNPPEMSLHDLYRLERMARVDEELVLVNRTRRALFAHQHDLPEIHDLMKELRNLVDEYPDRVLVGETDEISFYGSGQDELHLVFNFPLMRTGVITPSLVRNNQRQRLSELPSGAWPCNTLGNHDSPRMYSAFGVAGNAEYQAHLNIAMLLTIKGTPFLYYGEEIGMEDRFISDLAGLRDPLAFHSYYLERQVLGAAHHEAIEHANRSGRDRGRTPMQWSGDENGGFCPPDVRPWLQVHPNHRPAVNVQSQQKDPNSLWHFYRELLALRKRLPVLLAGEYELVEQPVYELLIYLRRSGGQTCLVALNYSDQPGSFTLPAEYPFWKTVFSTGEIPAQAANSQDLTLAPFQVWIAEGVQTKN